MVTEAAGGFGRGVARAALDSGASVVATARQPGKIVSGLSGHGNSLLVAALDTNDEQRASHVVDMAVEAYGRIDVLVHGSAADPLGILAVTRAALPVLCGGGHLVLPRPVRAAASGAGLVRCRAHERAVAAMYEALRAELAPLGITVTIR